MIENWKKNTVLFLASQAISLFGSSLVQYAITWHITLKTQSGLMMTIAIICGFLPTLILAPFAGVWADRFNRKMLIALADSLIAVSTLILAILFLMGYNAIWLLFALSAVRAAGSGIQSPAIGAFLPQMVPGEKLTRVHAVNGSIQSVIMVVSPMVSGALLATATIESIFFIDVVTAAAAVAILLFFLRVPLHAKAMEEQTAGYFADLRLGLRYIKNHDYLKKFFKFCAIFFFLVSPAAFLTPLQVTRTFGVDISNLTAEQTAKLQVSGNYGVEVWRLTAIEIAFSVGMIVGGIVMASWGGFKNKVYTMTLAGILFGACTFALGVVPVFWIYLVFMAVIGFALPLFNTPSTVMLQQKVEGDYLGRVFGIMSMISSSLMPLGMLLFGPLSDAVRIEWLLIGTGILMFIQGIFLLGNKTMLAAGKPEEKIEEAV